MSNNTLKTISQKKPIKAYYSEYSDENSKYAEIKIKFGKNEFVFVGAGNDKIDANWDLRDEIEKYTINGEKPFLESVQKQMEEAQIPIRNLEKLKKNQIKLVTKTLIPDSLLNAIANIDFLAEIAKEHNGMKIKYQKKQNPETGYIHFKFGDQEYKIFAMEIMDETVDEELVYQVNEINEKGKQDFLDKAETYTKERAKLSFWEKLFDC